MAKKKVRKKPSKETIVSAAINCFIKNGVAETTMSQVAQSAKIDQPLIRYYFPTPHSLYFEVFNVVLGALKGASVEPLKTFELDPVETLSRYIQSFFLFSKENPGLFSIWLYFYYLSSYSPQFTELNSTIRKMGRERISVFIYQGIEKGLFKTAPGFSVSETAVTIQGLITGNAIMQKTESGLDLDLSSITLKASLSLLSYKS